MAGVQTRWMRRPQAALAGQTTPRLSAFLGPARHTRKSPAHTLLLRQHVAEEKRRAPSLQADSLHFSAGRADPWHSRIRTDS